MLQRIMSAVVPTPSTSDAMSWDSSTNTNAAASPRGLLIEPWLFMDVIAANFDTKKAEALKRGRIIDPETEKPFGLLDIPWHDELEVRRALHLPTSILRSANSPAVASSASPQIAFMFMSWSIACLTPLLPFVWFLLPLSRELSAVLAGLLVLACTWPCGDWPVPPPYRYQMCARSALAPHSCLVAAPTPLTVTLHACAGRCGTSRPAAPSSVTFRCV